jgi:hypothetical protein
VGFGRGVGRRRGPDERTDWTHGLRIWSRASDNTAARETVPQSPRRGPLCGVRGTRGTGGPAYAADRARGGETHGWSDERKDWIPGLGIVSGRLGRHTDGGVCRTVENSSLDMGMASHRTTEMCLSTNPYWVCVLVSDSAKRCYVGITKDVDVRLSQHNESK